MNRPAQSATHQSSHTEMNQAKFDAAYRGLTGIARKVFEATPIAEAWQTSQVCTEIRRLGHGGDFKTVQGCLNSLTLLGLVTERPRGMFMRRAIREALAVIPFAETVTVTSQEIIMETKPVIQVTPTTPRLNLETKALAAKIHVADPMERLTDLTRCVGRTLDDLKTMMDQLDGLAIEILDTVQKKEQELHKLRQLQDLLRSLKD